MDSAVFVNTYKQVKDWSAEKEPLHISVLYLIFTCALCHFVRLYVRGIYAKRKQCFQHILVKEAIATFELCACCFELIIIADNYGVSTYAVCLFILTIWWNYIWDGASACPYTHIEDLLNGDAFIVDAVLKILVETITSLIVFKIYVQWIWWLEFTAFHAGRSSYNLDCTADLQVSPKYGFVVECIATMACRFASLSIGILEPKFATAIDSFIGTMMVVLAFDYSGGYFNPALATSLKLGCDGHELGDFLIVYWLGAIVGSVLGLGLFKYMGGFEVNKAVPKKLKKS